MKKGKLFILLGIIAVILIVFAVVAKKKNWIGRGSSVEVTTSKAEKNDITETVSASGKIYPETEVKISPDVSGEITEIFVEEGDSVKEKDLLLRIKPDIYISIVDRAEAAVNQAKANLANANARLVQANAQFENTKLSFQRNTKLHEQKVISEADYETATTAFKNVEAETEAARQSVKGAEFSVKSGEAAFKEAKDNLVKTNIYAPMNGILTKLNVEKGERVVGTTQMPGTEMLTIANLNEMEVRVDVSENDILRVGAGDTAIIEVDAYLDRKFKGTVMRLANSANTTSQLTSEQVTNFTVRIRILKDSYLDLLTNVKTQFPFKPGMSASVDIQTDKAFGILSVPLQCVTIREDEDEKVKSEIVFLLEGDKVKEVPVTTGIQDDRFIEIKEGIAEGDEVISGPYRAISKLLKDGDYVKKVSEKELSE